MYIGLPRSIEIGFLDIARLGLLTNCVEEKKNILVLGGAGSGKTTLLNDLLRLINPTDTIALYENVQEINPGDQLVVRKRLKPDITEEDFLQTSYIVFDEVRPNYQTTNTAFLRSLKKSHGIAALFKDDKEPWNIAINRFSDDKELFANTIHIIVELQRNHVSNIYKITGLINNHLQFEQIF